MRKAVIILVLLLIVLAFFVGLFISKISFTGNVVQDNSYSWTKALCNSDNECMDVEITCNNGQVSSIVPISKLVVHSDDWKDPRGSLADKLC